MEGGAITLFMKYAILENASGCWYNVFPGGITEFDVNTIHTSVIIIALYTISDFCLFFIQSIALVVKEDRTLLLEKFI